MAKRGRQAQKRKPNITITESTTVAKKKNASGNGEDKAVKAATQAEKDGGNGEDKKPTTVNPDYDAMPDEIADPGNTFKMALLDTQCVALQNKRKFAELNYNLQLANTQKKMAQELAEIDAELKRLKQKYIEQKEYIEEKHGIALKSYTYNDETGVLTKQIQMRVTEESNNG